MGAVHVNDLPLEVRRNLGLRKSREQRLSQDDIRGYAIAALYPLRELSRRERSRVLAQMVKMNVV